MTRPVKHYGRWRIRWTDHVGERQSAVFESHDDARRALLLAESEVERIRLGLVLPTPTERTFAELAAYWREVKLPTLAAWKTQRSHLGLYLVPFFGSYPLAQISVEDVRRFASEVKHRRGGRKGGRPLADKTVHHILTTLASMFSEAVDLGWLLHAPKVHKPRLQAPDFLFLRSLDDVRALVAAAGEEGEGTDVFYATAAYTGLRAGELAGLRLSCVDLKLRLITVAASYGQATKSRKIRHVPILDPLLPILRDWSVRSSGPLVFPNTVGKMRQPSDRIFQEVFHRSLERAGLPRMRFHDLRHTFASHWVMAGGALFKLQKILGHSTPQMTLRYAHLQPDAFASDWGLLGAEKAGVVREIGSGAG